MLLRAELILVLVSNFFLLGTSRFSSMVRGIAVQGFAVACVSLTLPRADFSLRVLVLSICYFAVFGVLVPLVLSRATKQSYSVRERTPLISHSSSILLGTAILALSWMVYANAGFVITSAATLLLPYALSAVLFGLLLVMSRRQALSQIIGYVSLTNGVSLFALGLAAEQPFILELMIIFDAFLVSLVMAVGMYRIERTFSSIDVSSLQSLRDHQ